MVLLTQARCCSALHPCVRQLEASSGLPGMGPHRLGNEEHVNFGQAAQASTYPRLLCPQGRKEPAGAGRRRAVDYPPRGAELSRAIGSPGVAWGLGLFARNLQICLLLCSTSCTAACLGRQGYIWQVPCPVPHLPFRSKWENNSRDH